MYDSFTCDFRAEPRGILLIKKDQISIMLVVRPDGKILKSRQISFIIKERLLKVNFTRPFLYLTIFDLSFICFLRLHCHLQQ